MLSSLFCKTAKGLHAAIAALLAVAFLAGVARAESAISIDFQGNVQGNLAPTDVAGYVPKANWNNAAGADGSANALKDSSGAATKASVAWSSCSTWSTGVGQGTADMNMMNGDIMAELDGHSYGKPDWITVTLTNIPYAAYDVYVYCDAYSPDQKNGGNGFKKFVSLNGETKVTFVQQGPFNGKYAVAEPGSPLGPANCIKFTNVTGATCKIIASGIYESHQQSSKWASINGIQIVSKSGKNGDRAKTAAATIPAGSPSAGEGTTPAAPPTPAPVARTASTQPGLKGDYYNDANLGAYVFTRIDPVISFNWGRHAPDPRITAHTTAYGGSAIFSIRWTGQVQAQRSETYTFYVSVDDGARLWVNGELIFDHWEGFAKEAPATPVTLVKGKKYDIKLEMFQSHVWASCHLSWSSPSTPKQIVPQEVLFSPVGAINGIQIVSRNGDHNSKPATTPSAPGNPPAATETSSAELTARAIAAKMDASPAHGPPPKQAVPVEPIELVRQHVVDYIGFNLAGGQITLPVKAGQGAAEPTSVVAADADGITVRSLGTESRVTWKALGEEGIYQLAQPLMAKAPVFVEAAWLKAGIKLGHAGDAAFKEILEKLRGKDAEAAKVVESAIPAATPPPGNLPVGPGPANSS